MTWLGSLDLLRQDLSYGWRSIRRTPGFTLTIVLTLALGLGLNVTTFTLLDTLYLRPPAGIDDDGAVRRVWFESSRSRREDGSPSSSPIANYPMYRAVVGAAGDPRNAALFRTENALHVGRGSRGPRVRAVLASASYFSVLGVRPIMGRTYTTAEDSLGNGSRVIVLSHRFWTSELGADPAIVGKPIDIGSDRYTVIGVLGPAFTGLDLQAADVWIPLAAMPSSLRFTGRWWESPQAWAFQALLRLPSGADEARFQQLATSAVRVSNREQWGANGDTLMNVRTGSIIEARGPGPPEQDKIISTRLSGVAVIVLLIACANVINLLLGRAVQRRREIAVRLALGISRSRLIRLLTTETVLLAAIAGIAAVLAAWWGGALLRSLLFPDVQWYESPLHWRVVAFAATTALLAGVIAGLVPALQSSNPELTRALKDGARGGSVRRSRLRGALVVSQAALSMTLLVGAALFVRSLQNVQGLDLGYDADRLLFGSVRFEPGEAAPEAVIGATMNEIASRLQTRPGVEAVARSGYTPMQGLSWIDFYWGSDSSGKFRGRTPTWQAVSPTFFSTVGMRLLRGSVFDTARGVQKQVVINDAMATLLWPDREPVGQCMRFQKRANPCYTVVGVVENARRDNVIENEAHAQYYLPLGNLPVTGWEGSTLIVRTRPDAALAASAELLSALRAAFPSAEPIVRPMTTILEPEYRPWRLGATLFTAFGLLALLVAVIGIYSSVSYGVSQRTHEFGVRVALGAQVADVLRQVIGEGLSVVALGVAVGIALALAAGKLISALLYGVEPNDPGVMLIVSATLLVVAALAALIPAWRAARVDPLTALRSE